MVVCCKSTMPDSGRGRLTPSKRKFLRAAAILQFALTLLPAEAGMLAWLPALILQIVVAGSAWTTAGALVQRGFRGTFHPRVGYRVSALALILLAGGLSAHVLASA